MMKSSRVSTISETEGDMIPLTSRGNNMPTELSAIKKKISEDWLDAFPQLTIFARNKFYKMLGGLIIGIEAVSIPNIKGYKPHFVIYPLWKENLIDCLNRPLICHCIRNKKCLEFSIPYLKHSSLFWEAVDCTKIQIPISFERDVPLTSLFDFINISFNDILVKTNSAEQAMLYELLFNTALYTNNKDKIIDVLNQIQNKSKSWDMRMFEIWYGNFDIWLLSLKDRIKHRDLFLKQIGVNMQDKKITLLKRSALV